MIHVHELNGCAPVPLAHYLKALGVLRLVTEQADAQARAWWEDEHFRLATKLGSDEFEVFFVEQYEPTPLLAPWNGASGFFKTWDQKAKKLRKSKNADALQRLLAEKSKRWDVFRDSYQVSVAALGKVLREVNVAELPEKERKNLLIVPRGDGPVFPVADKDDDKATVQRTMMWSRAQNEFYRSAIVDMGADTPAYPSLWGSGGNDGAIDFTARYFENLIQALVDNKAELSKQWLASSLRASPSLGLLTGKKGKVGQFLPGGAGGANSTSGIGTQDDTLLNPWDFIMMMEGAVLFTAHATRRLGINESTRAAAPFAVNAQSAGYASASDEDESARGEQWMPLWSRPMSLAELKRLLAEGRAQIGARPVRDPLDLARAVARLGTARGITAFQRYGYIERNGQSNLAVPLGRFFVPDQALPQSSCLDDLEVWMRQLRSATRDEAEKEKNNSRRLRSASRRLGDSILKVTQHPETPAAWQLVLKSLVDAEEVIASGRGYTKAGPIPRLRPEWVEAADDAGSEFRLALSFALQARAFDRESGKTLDPIRRHWLPLDEEKPWKFATTGTGSQTRLQIGPEVVMAGRKGIDDAIALVERRLIEAGQHGERRLPLQAAVRAAAHPADLAALIAGSVDMDRTLSLGRALMALDRELWPQQFIEVSRPVEMAWPDDAWLVIRLAHLPWPLRRHPGAEHRIGTDPAVFRRLASGDASTAVELALRRLRAAGIRTTVRVAAVSPETARLWAGALAFPISQRTATAFLRRLDPNTV